MADGYLDPRLLAPREGWFNPVLRGLEAEQSLHNQILNRQIASQNLQQKQAEQQALQQYGKTGDPKAFQGTDPMMQMRITEWLQSQPPQGLEDIAKASAFAQKIASNLNSKSWPSIRPKFVQAYPNLPKDALPPENATDQQLFQWANAAKIADAQIAAMKKGPQIRGSRMVDPVTGQISELPPTQVEQARINRENALIQKYDIGIVQKNKELAIKEAELGIKRERLTFDKTKPQKGGFNENKSYEAADKAWEKYAKSDEIDHDVTAALTKKHPDWFATPTDKLTPEQKAARVTERNQVRNDLKKNFRENFVDEQRRRAGATGGGGATTAPITFEEMEQMGPEELRKVIQRMESSGGGGQPEEDEE